MISTTLAMPVGAAQISTKHQALSTSQIDKTAQEFEGVFLAQMLQHMFDGVQVDPLSGQSEANESYKSLLVDEYGRLLAKAGGIGIADYVRKEMLTMQEKGL